MLAVVAPFIPTAVIRTKADDVIDLLAPIMLALASCYLMWMITYMAQLHPLICAWHVLLESAVLTSVQHQ